MITPEEPKRLAPTRDTARELFLKSGNLCAFPNCSHLMMNADGAFIGEVCHIEAAEPGGERFNPAMSNEERRAFANLMLMCHAHHVITNDVVVYPVERMRSLKSDHERRFASPGSVILETLRDWTEASQPTRAATLGRLNVVLGWNMSQEELARSVAELDGHIDRLQNVPVEARGFLAAVTKRAMKMESTRVVRSMGHGGTAILVSDLRDALRMSEASIGERANELDSYNLADIDFIETDLGDKPAVRIRDLRSGWPLWPDLVRFAETEGIDLSVFWQDLDFRRLDG